MTKNRSRREELLEERLLLFFLLSCVGWVWEVLLTACISGTWVNRGMLRGPWLPVYGVGGVVLASTAERLGRSWAVPLAGAVLGGVIEYGTSLALEARFQQRWWDYTGQAGSLQGRVCLMSVTGFALAAWALVWVAPWVRERFRRMRPKVRTALCRSAAAVYAADWALALVVPNTGAGITCRL